MFVRSNMPCIGEPGRYEAWAHVAQSDQPRFLQIQLEGDAAAIEAELELSPFDGPRPPFERTLAIARAHIPEGYPEISPEQVVTFALIRQCEVPPGETHHDGATGIARSRRTGNHRLEVAARYVHVTPKERRLIEKPMLLSAFSVALNDPVNNSCDLSIPTGWGEAVRPAVWAPLTEAEMHSRRTTPVVVQGGVPARNIGSAIFVVVHHQRKQGPATKLGSPIEQIYPSRAA